jgi:hypothetical protein
MKMHNLVSIKVLLENRTSGTWTLEETHYEELAHVVMKAAKFHCLPSAN